jgi:hypothetical protein
MLARMKILIMVLFIGISFSACSKQAFVLVPSFIQKDVNSAREWAKENQISLEINQQPAPPSLGIKPGRIMNQAPNPGSEIVPGDSVIVYVALKAPYDPRVAKSNLEYDLAQVPRANQDFDKFANLLKKDIDLSLLKFDYKTITTVPKVNYKKLRTDLNSLELPREVEGNILYLSMLNSLNKVVNLQSTSDVNSKDLLKAVNEFEEQRHLFNQLIQ